MGYLVWGDSLEPHDSSNETFFKRSIYGVITFYSKKNFF